MGGSEADKKPAVPEWQRPKPQEAVAAEASSRSDNAPATVRQAKRFLQDDQVRKYSREQKMEFLKGKGFEEGLVQQLLQEGTESEASAVSCPISRSRLKIPSLKFDLDHS